MIESWFSLALALLVVGVFFLTNKKKDAQPPSRTLNSFVTDISALARKKSLEPFVGREAEIDRTIHIVMRRSKNNPLLIGNPGVGKTAIIHGLAERIERGDVPAALKGKEILALNIGEIMAGTQYRGELEKRLRALLSDLESNPRKTILFIDEVHMIEQANGAEGALNVSDIFKPALSRGELQIIGATTWSEYETYIRKDPALDRRFQPVLVDEPKPKDAIAMLKTLRPVYEEFHGVTIPDRVIEAAVKLSDKQIRGRYLPDKAIDLIDEASAKVSIESSQHTHTKHLGVLHGASQKKKGATVSVEDIQDVLDQWVIHSKAEGQRDARART